MGCISLISQYLSELQIRTVAHIQATNHRQKRLVSLLCPWLILKKTEDLRAWGSHRPLFNILALLPASSCDHHSDLVDVTSSTWNSVSPSVKSGCLLRQVVRKVRSCKISRLVPGSSRWPLNIYPILRTPWNPPFSSFIFSVLCYSLSHLLPILLSLPPSLKLWPELFFQAFIHCYLFFYVPLNFANLPSPWTSIIQGMEAREGERGGAALRAQSWKPVLTQSPPEERFKHRDWGWGDTRIWLPRFKFHLYPQVS